MRAPITALALSLAIALPANAQSTDSTSVVPLGRDSVRTSLFLVNPLFIVFGAFNGEIEQVVNRSASVGLGGTYVSSGEFHYTTIEAKARYYPSEAAPDGFSLAVSAGYTRVSGDFICFDICDSPTRNYPTAGFELDYNWLLGRARHFTVGTGIGAKRLFGSHDNGTSEALPTLRLVIGFAN